MHTVYIGTSCIVVCTPDDEALTDPNSIEYRSLGKLEIPALLALLETSSTLSRIYIPTENVEETYRSICSEFKEVNAAGGLISNQRGDFLLIYRYGLWDLPKGHQEDNEDIRMTALREVREETGLEKLKTGELICITDHCYCRNHIWHLKHTWWYDMLYTDHVDLAPQREEDISKAVWVAKSNLPPFLKNTYPSIVEVFKKAKV